VQISAQKYCPKYLSPEKYCDTNLGKRMGWGQTWKLETIPSVVGHGD